MNEITLGPARYTLDEWGWRAVNTLRNLAGLPPLSQAEYNAVVVKAEDDAAEDGGLFV